MNKYIKDLTDSAKNFTPDSEEAKVLNNAIETINNQRKQILGSAMQDPTLPTKKEAYKKLLQKVENIKFQNEIGVPQAQAIDTLFNKVAKLKSSGFKADSVDAERIMKDFNLGDTDSAIQMAKDIVKLKITKPQINKLTGEIEDIPVELVQVIKKYEPKIGEKGSKLYLERGPGKVRESEILPFRAEQVEAPLEMTPQQLRSLESKMREISQIKDPAGVVTEIAKDLRQGTLDGLPKEAAERFKQGMATHADVNRFKDLVDKNVISKFQGAEKTQAQQKLANILESEHGFGGAGPAHSELVRTDIKDTLSRIDPEFGQMFSKESADIAKRIDLNRVGDVAGMQQSSLLSGGIEAGGVRVGVGIGGGMAKVERMSKAVKSIAGLPKQKLADLAKQTAKSSPKLSNFLNNLANVENPQRKSALIFAASQKPDLKEDIASLFGFDKDE